MKNFLYIIVDSIYSDCLKDLPGRVSPTPFLNEFKRECLNYENVFSQAPFTEAALMALVSGQNTLSNGGYINKFQNTKTDIYKYFDGLGYDVFHYLHPNNYDLHEFAQINKGLYTMGADLNILWMYRLSYYHTKLQKSGLNAYDYFNIEENIELLINSAISFYEDLKTGADSCGILVDEGMENVAVDQNLALLRQQKNEYLQDKKAYIHALLTLKEKHALYDVDIINRRSVKGSPIWNEYVKSTYHDFLSDSDAFEKECNKRNNNIEWKYFFRLFKKLCIDCSKDTAKLPFKYLRNHSSMLKKSEFSNFEDANGTFNKAVPSMKYCFRHFMKWLDERDADKPYFAKLHVEDNHYKSTFFSYDLQDKKEIDKEFADLKDYFQKIESDYKGSLCYDYSLVYLDHCMKELILGLKERGELENTLIVITADHGYSFSYLPVRENFVTNFYRENFKVPLMIYNDHASGNDVHIRSSVDILPTVLDMMDLPENPYFEGKSFYGGDGKGYVLHEYMGMGCPDILGRDSFLGIRSEEYLLIYRVSVKKSFAEGTIVEFYDLKKDPYQKNNIIRRKRYQDVIKPMLAILEERHKKIKNDIRELEERIECS